MQTVVKKYEKESESKTQITKKIGERKQNPGDEVSGRGVTDCGLLLYLSRRNTGDPIFTTLCHIIFTSYFHKILLYHFHNRSQNYTI